MMSFLQGWTNSYRVYLQLLFHAKGKYGYLLNDDKYLEKLTGRSRATIKRHLKALREMGLVSYTKDKKFIHLYSQTKFAYKLAIVLSLSEEEMRLFGVGAFCRISLSRIESLVDFRATLMESWGTLRGHKQALKRGSRKVGILFDDLSPVKLAASRKDGNKKDNRWEEKNVVRQLNGGELYEMKFHNKNNEAILSSDYCAKALGISRASVVRYFKTLEKKGDAVKYPRRFEFSLKDEFCSVEDAKAWFRQKANKLETKGRVKEKRNNTFIYEMCNSYVFLNSCINDFHFMLNYSLIKDLSTSCWEEITFPLKTTPKGVKYDFSLFRAEP